MGRPRRSSSSVARERRDARARQERGYAYQTRVVGFTPDWADRPELLPKRPPRARHKHA